METINCSFVRSSCGGTFLLVCTSSDALNNIYSFSSSSMSLMMYFSNFFVVAEISTTTMWRVFYVGVNTGGGGYILDGTH